MIWPRALAAAGQEGDTRTGTVELTAIQVLQKAAHTYRHDLESLFYFLLCICARWSWEAEFQCTTSDKPQQSILEKWYTGTFEEIAQMKRGAQRKT